jgi:hypothetical protein
MRGPTPKPAHLRQRTNRTSTAATLPSAAASATNVVPPMPDRVGPNNAWHPRVVEWWKDAWTSPMSKEWLASDVSGVFSRLAELWQDFWMAKEAPLRERLSKAITPLETELGMTPIARRRLQWSIEQGETAVDRTEKRRTSKRLAETSKKDPRDVLRIAK